VDKQTKILFWVCGSVAVAFFLCGGIGVLLTSMRPRDPLSEPGPVLAQRRKLDLATPEEQARRAQLINDSSELIYRADSRTVDVRPLWHDLALDDKRAAAVMVWLWATNAKSLVSAIGTDEEFHSLTIRDYRTGKQIATFSPGAGLRID
jgi:hypothetical protein